MYIHLAPPPTLSHYVFSTRFMSRRAIPECTLLDIQHRESDSLQPSHVINLPVKDTHEEATIGAIHAFQLMGIHNQVYHYLLSLIIHFTLFVSVRFGSVWFVGGDFISCYTLSLLYYSIAFPAKRHPKLQFGGSERGWDTALVIHFNK